MDLDAAQPVVEVRAEQASNGHFGKRPVRRGNDACVHAANALASHTFDGQVLDDPQQLRLRRQRQIGDLVEKQCASIGVFELAPTTSNAGGRSLLDPEQLRLEQRLDDRRAIDRDERAAPTPAQLVHLARDELLAGSALAFDQDREVSGGDTLDTRPQILHDRRGSNERRNGDHRPDPGRHATACNLEDQSTKLCDGLQRVEVVFVEAPAGIARRFEHRLYACVRRGHTENDRIGGASGSYKPGLIPRTHLSQSNRPKLECLPYLLLERRLEVLIAGMRAQRGSQCDEHLPQSPQTGVSV